MNKSNEHIFSTEHLNHDLKGRTVRSGVVTMVAQAVQFFLQIGSTMALARLLTPDDFGLIAMVVALTNFAILFKDLGLSMATVQRAEVNHAQVSTLFWINVGISCGVALVIAALAPVVSSFYHEPRLLGATLLLSSTFILGGLAVQHQALLRRQMRFRQLALIQIGASVMSIATAVTLAWIWRGTPQAYMALVWMQVSHAAFTALGTWGFCRWLPGLPSQGAGVRSMLRFGADVTGFEIVNYFSRNLDNILIGKFWGAASLGLYAKAYQIVLFPLNNIRIPINSVAMPALSRLQNQPEQFRSYYIRLVLILSTLSMPLMAFFFVASSEVVGLLFGPYWMGMTPLFKVLTVAGFTQVVSGTRGVVLLSLGKSKRYFQLGGATAFFTVICFLVGISHGATGVAVSYAIMTYVTLPVCFLYAFHGMNIGFKDFISGIWRNCISCIVAVVVVSTIEALFSISSPLLSLVVKAVAGGVIMFGTLLVLPGGRQQVVDLKNMIRDHLLRKSKIIRCSYGCKI